MVGGPGCGHAVWEADRVVDDEDVGFVADAEEEGGFLEFLLASFAEAVCVACESIVVSFHRPWDFCTRYMGLRLLLMCLGEPNGENWRL